MPPVRGIRNLPDKTLVVIFDYAARFTIQDTHRTFPTLVLLSQVSQRWRTIAHDTPALWRTIPIIDPSHLKYAKFFIEKSGDCELDVFVHAKNAGTSTALATILMCADRLSSLAIRIATGPLLFAVVNALKNAKMSRLDQLEVMVDIPSTRVGHIPPIFTEKRPPITSLRLEGSSVDYGSPLFASLTTLTLACLPRDIGQPTHSAFQGLFISSPSLRHLTLVCVVPKLPSGVEHNEIHAPSLRTLSLTVTQSCNVSHVQELFSILSAPHLETFSYTADGTATLRAVESSIPVISARHPLIQELRLTILSSQPPSGPVVHMGLFQSFPELRYLVLNVVDDEFADYFILAWIMASDPSSADNVPLIWPKFELLTLRAPYIEREEGEQVDDLLETLGSARFSLGLKFDVLEESISDDRFAALRKLPDLDHRWPIASSDRRAMQTRIAFTDARIDDD